MTCDTCKFWSSPPPTVMEPDECFDWDKFEEKATEFQKLRFFLTHSLPDKIRMDPKFRTVRDFGLQVFEATGDCTRFPQVTQTPDKYECGEYKKKGVT